MSPMVAQLFKHAYFILPLLIASTGLATASPVLVTTSGTFSSGDVKTALAAPGANWTVSFDVDTNPVAENPGPDGFDAPFTNFVYTLGGVKVAETPQSIRFYDNASYGLFSLFFGPEIGSFPNGMLVPEFDFSGAQLFTRSVNNPTLVLGSYPVTEFLYSDGYGNYDYQVNPGTTVTLAAGTVATTPEPATLGLFFLVASLLCAQWLLHRRSNVVVF